MAKKLLDRPEAQVSAPVPTEIEPPAERPPLPPVRPAPKRLIRWMGLLAALIVLGVVGALTWMNVSSEEPLAAGEPWTPTDRGLADVPFEAELEIDQPEPWTPEARGLFGLAAQGPWTPADRGSPVVTEFDRPWTPETRGIP